MTPSDEESTPVVTPEVVDTSEPAPVPEVEALPPDDSGNDQQSSEESADDPDDSDDGGDSSQSSDQDGDSAPVSEDTAE